jgi:hypothetical protein
VSLVPGPHVVCCDLHVITSPAWRNVEGPDYRLIIGIGSKKCG